jgi:hypothetical protein
MKGFNIILAKALYLSTHLVTNRRFNFSSCYYWNLHCQMVRGILITANHHLLNSSKNFFLPEVSHH